MTTVTPPSMNFPSGTMSPGQMAWLSGFLAGLLGNQSGAGGSMTTTAVSASSAGVAEEEFAWHDPALSMEERMQMAEGKPPARQLMAAMAQLDCGTCGYHCQTYAEAIVSGVEKSLTKCTPGGAATAKKVKQLVALLKEGQPVSTGGASSSATVVMEKEEGWTRFNPFSARLLRASRLNRCGSDKDTRQVVIDLTGAGESLQYEPGDSLGVYPENTPFLVEALCRRLGVSLETMVMDPKRKSLPLGEALQKDWDITRPTEAVLEVLEESATNGEEARRLAAIRADADSSILMNNDLLDLLEMFPSARPAPEHLLGALGELPPRLYSISSSLKEHPEQVHLTVGVVRYDKEGRERLGVASTFLSERAMEGETVKVFLQKSHGFRLPKGLDCPIIMIGPGTGIAPFRAFLQERRACGAKGKNWLFFGDQKRLFDFLYEEELQTYCEQGILTRLDTAFSRDQDKKVYVQHRILENGPEIWRWIQAGAYIYVCGDAKRMARDVDQALREVIAQNTGKAVEQASIYLKDLTKSGRYLKDVY